MTSFWRRLFIQDRETPPSLSIQSLNIGLILLLLSFGISASFASIDYHWSWDSLWNYRVRFLHGWLVTLGLSAAALFLSTFIGFVAALAQRSRFLPLSCLSRIYVEIVRGTPLLVQILILFYVVGNALHVENRYVVGVCILSLFSGAYISEVIRSGIESVGRSQIESAEAIGLTHRQTYRLVIFPQAMRHVLPSLAGQFASLVKDSSLLSIIAIHEFTLNAEEVNAYTYSTLESYLPLAIGYLAITLPLSLWTQWLEKKFRYET